MVLMDEEGAILPECAGDVKLQKATRNDNANLGPVAIYRLPFFDNSDSFGQSPPRCCAIKSLVKHNSKSRDQDYLEWVMY